MSSRGLARKADELVQGKRMLILDQEKCKPGMVRSADPRHRPRRPARAHAPRERYSGVNWARARPDPALRRTAAGVRVPQEVRPLVRRRVHHPRSARSRRTAAIALEDAGREGRCPPHPLTPRRAHRPDSHTYAALKQAAMAAVAPSATAANRIRISENACMACLNRAKKTPGESSPGMWPGRMLDPPRAR